MSAGSERNCAADGESPQETLSATGAEDAGSLSRSFSKTPPLEGEASNTERSFGIVELLSRSAP